MSCIKIHIKGNHQKILMSRHSNHQDIVAFYKEDMNNEICLRKKEKKKETFAETPT